MDVDDADGAQDNVNVHADDGGRADEDDRMMVDGSEAGERPMVAGSVSEVEMKEKTAKEGAQKASSKQSESSGESNEK